MNRKIAIGIVSVLTILLVGVGASKFLSGKKPEEMKIPKVTKKKVVKAEKVIYSDIVTEISSTGRLSAQQTVDVITEVQGKLIEGEVPLKKGESFKKGDLLFSVYSKNADYALKAHKSNFITLLAGLLPDIKIDYPDEYNTWYNYFSAVEIDKSLPDLPGISSDKIKIFMASRNLLNTFYSIKAEEVQLSKYKIYAPFTGSYVNVNLEIGSVANPGTRVAQIIKTGMLEIEVPVKTEDYQWIKVGSKVKVLSENGRLSTEARVVRKSVFINENTQTFNVYINIANNPTFNLYSGQYLTVQFPGIKLDQVMEIPRNAIFNFDNVFEVDSGLLKTKQVNINKFSETTAFINGLDTGKMIVVEPIANAKENTEVEIYKPVAQ